MVNENRAESSSSPATISSHTVLGFDFGTKRIGVAVGQTLTRNANPLTTISAKEGIPDWQQIDHLIEKWRPQGLVVGKPLNMDGTEQPLTQAATCFAKRLQARYHLPIYEMDERLSTVAAKTEIFAKGGYRALKKKPVDSVAAQLILIDWLNEHS
jgi:putative holliday junction resolvase